MAVAIANVPCTMTGDIELDNICEDNIRASFKPTALADVIYSSSLTLETFDRISRPKLGTLIMAMAIKAFRNDGPSTATIAIANKIEGKASIISKNLEIIVSTHLP